jgi:hypothetical protein
LAAGLFFGISFASVALIIPFAADSFLGLALLRKTFRGHSGAYVQPKELVFKNSAFETI